MAFGSILWVALGRLDFSSADSFVVYNIHDSGGDGGGMAMAMSVAIYSFEGAGLVLSLEHSLGVGGIFERNVVF